MCCAGRGAGRIPATEIRLETYCGLKSPMKARAMFMLHQHSVKSKRTASKPLPVALVVSYRATVSAPSPTGRCKSRRFQALEWCGRYLNTTYVACVQY